MFGPSAGCSTEALHARRSAEDLQGLLGRIPDAACAILVTLPPADVPVLRNQGALPRLSRIRGAIATSIRCCAARACEIAPR